MRTLLVGIILCFFLPRGNCAENWPGWRGPTGMGQTDERDLPLTWGGEKQENVLWKAALFPDNAGRLDQNQSSPIVWGNQVFVTTSYWPRGVSEKEYPEHHVTCYAAATGAKVWDVKVPPGPWKLTDFRGGYTAPTPACDGSHVFVLFGSSVLAAIDLKGAIVWRQEITPFFFDVCIGTSPVIYKNTVIVSCDLIGEKKSSQLLAFDGKTGKIAWQKQRAVDWAHSTPTLATVMGKPQLVTATANGPQGLDPATGDILWEHRVKDRIGDTVSPIVIGDTAYVDSGRGSPGIAFDIGKKSVRWRIAVPEGFSSPVVVGDYLYRLHKPAVLSCWKWTDGKEVFKERLPGIDPAISPFVTPEGRIYLGGAGESAVVQAGPKLQILAHNDLGDPSRASPAVAAGRIYLKGSRFLFCVGKK